jgi:ABC-type antimicrobial peptide transport system permease subunit
MEVPLVAGRAFSPEDRSGSEPVAIISEATARQYWPGQDPVGQMIHRPSTETTHRIVGVARDTKVWWLGEEIQPYVYLPRPQDATISAFFVARGTIPDAQIVGQLRRTIREVDPRLVIMDIKTLPEHLAVQLFPARAAAALLGAFGILALILATTGLYGTVAFAVSRRTREMGIRLSLGAESGGVVKMVLAGAMGMVLAGSVVGLALSLMLGQAIGGFLIGVSPTDPLILASVPAILLSVATLAAFLPARRASRVNPVQALRSE